MKHQHAIHIKSKGMKIDIFRVAIALDEDQRSAHRHEVKTPPLTSA